MPDVERGVEQREYNGLKYWRYTDDIGTTLRGTVILFDTSGQRPVRTIPGFPHIRRVYRLRPGVQRFFHTNPFFVEEKLDGYNVRLLIHQGQLLALTRGGFVCPFTQSGQRSGGTDTILNAFLQLIQTMFYLVRYLEITPIIRKG